MQREEIILNLLNENRYLSVHKLAKVLNVSEPTARRSIAEMEKKKLVKRTYGGVMSISGSDYVPVIIREKIARKSKQIIAAQAAEMIRDGMVIFLDSSSTAKCVAEYLHEAMKITVVTNSCDLCEVLVRQHIRTFCVGGYVNEAEHAICGPFATEFISHFMFDIAFFSCMALSDSGVLSGATLDGVTFLRALLPHAKTRVLLCIPEKIGQERPYLICSLQEIDRVLTDGPLPENLQAMVRDGV